MKNRQKIGMHDYDVACSPKNGVSMYASQESFSVGIFQWVSKKSGIGMKKGPIIVRVRGSVRCDKAVSVEAGRICDLLDAGKYKGPKTIWAPDLKS